ncbi:hypothetical protein DBR24_12115 [Pseudomonas sp. HMWF006]|nr:hypothetical protein DBR24_12115 [Pseudomonas sp. HMWF006]PTT67231.1 hypothetical protein DBR26_15810 [Pseudomonas sp. HMWF007]PTT92811.1 hypothetical protein DBR29_08290 [Pseudomonas sp. HMWF005]
MTLCSLCDIEQGHRLRSIRVDLWTPATWGKISSTPTIKYLCLPTGAKFIIDTQGYEDVWMAE